MKRAVLLTLSIFFLLLPLTLGIGFGDPPGNREVIFAPNKQVSIPLIVTLGSHIVTSVSSPYPGTPELLGTPQDDNILAYTTLRDDAPLTGEHTVYLNFNFPARMRPGTYYIDVYASDVIDTPSEATVTAVATTKLRFTVRVLSPEKALDILGMDIAPIAEGLDANMSVRLASRTTQRLDAVTALFTVQNNGTVLASAQSEKISLPSGEDGVLHATLPVERLHGGDYDVFVNVTYDEFSTYGGPEVLKIGTLHVGIEGETKTFLYNATNRFLFNISNQWNRELQEVYAVVHFAGQEKKTASHGIGPFGRTEYEVYFDRDENLALGSYPLNVTISFHDYDPDSGQYLAKEETLPLTVEVVAPTQESSALNMTTILFVATGVLLLVVVILLLVIMRRKPQQPAQPAQPPAQPGS